MPQAKKTAAESPEKAPVGAPTAAARVDQDLVASAYRKVMAKQELTKGERRALKAHERDKEQRLRWQYYRSIPQKHWREMSGRQAKVINEQAARYGIPFGGASVDLPAVVRALHEFLADNAQALAREADDLLRGGPNEPASPALERYREERALLARLDRLERQRALLPRQEVRDALGRIGAILRGAGEALGRDHGAAAAEILHEALDDALREVDRSFSEPADEHHRGEDLPTEPGDGQAGVGAGGGGGGGGGGRWHR